MKRVLTYLGIIVGLLVLFSMFRIYKIDGTSMNYGMVEGDVVLCKRQVDTIKRGDMLVVRHPLDPKGRLYVKRCAALPGDRFFQKERFFYLQIDGDSSKTYQLALQYDLEVVSTKDGYFLKNPYLKYYGVVHNWNLKVPGELSKLPMMTVEDDHYYVLGDYRDNSADSRFFGAVPRDWVMSKVIYVLKKPRDWMTLLEIKEADSSEKEVKKNGGLTPSSFKG
ncbi:signal peptidase I [Sulfurovum lithotrophicum]|nr:signal peptidase I [Sulfurovum lithotrophicum]